MFSFIKNAVARYRRNQRGAMAITFTLALVPMLVAIGAAIDFDRVLNARVALRSSLDSAALYAAGLSDTTNAALTSKAQVYLTNNYLNLTDSSLSNFAIVNNGTTVTATATVSLKTSFLNLIGINTLGVNGTSTVLKQGINLEVALIMDNTGSMGSANPATGNTAIADSIAAAKLFVQMVPPAPGNAATGQAYTKIAVVPYNNSVNLGNETNASYARGAIATGTSTTPGAQNFTFNTASVITTSRARNYWGITCNNYSNSGTAVCQRTFTSSTCVTERVGSQAYTDASPYNTSGQLVAPVGYAYLPTGNPCSVTPMLPLQTTAAPLNSTLGAMVSGNSTAGQVGIAWGWYALSPNFGMWSGTSVPASYSVTVGSPTFNPATPNLNQVHKVMILMTDGNYNSANCNGVITGQDPVLGSSSLDGSAPGTGNPADHIGCNPTNSDTYTQANAMCTAIKASGVEIYVVTFQLDPTQTRNVALTQNCATDAKHVIDADTTSPSAAFAIIANQLNAMRIQS